MSGERIRISRDQMIERRTKPNVLRKKKSRAGADGQPGGEPNAER